MRDIRSPLDGFLSPFGAQREFNPAALFANGEIGVWFDPSDLSTMFQDTAGTTPVTAAGQTVARINDKSGNGLNATQATAAARPTYQVDTGGRGYLAFDGVDDFLRTGTITPGTDKVQVFAGARKLSDGAVKELITFSGPIATTSGSFALRGSEGAAMVFRSRGTGSIGVSGLAQSAPFTFVATGLGDIAADFCRLRVNGQTGSITTFDQGAGNYTAGPLSIGARTDGASPTDCHVYSVITRFGSNLDIALIEKAEGYAAKNTGIAI